MTACFKCFTLGLNEKLNTQHLFLKLSGANDLKTEVQGRFLFCVKETALHDTQNLCFKIMGLIIFFFEEVILIILLTIHFEASTCL